MKKQPNCYANFLKEIPLIKGKYLFKSPYHKELKYLPFVVNGAYYSDDFPIWVDTVEYRGWDCQPVSTGYKLETIKEFISTGFIIPANQN